MKYLSLLILVGPALGGCAAYDAFSRSVATNSSNYRNTATVCSGPSQRLMSCTEVSRHEIEAFVESFSMR